MAPEALPGGAFPGPQRREPCRSYQGSYSLGDRRIQPGCGGGAAACGPGPGTPRPVFETGRCTRTRIVTVNAISPEDPDRGEQHLHAMLLAVVVERGLGWASRCEARAPRERGP